MDWYSHYSRRTLRQAAAPDSGDMSLAPGGTVAPVEVNPEAAPEKHNTNQQDLMMQKMLNSIPQDKGMRDFIGDNKPALMSPGAKEMAYVVDKTVQRLGPGGLRNLKNVDVQPPPDARVRPAPTHTLKDKPTQMEQRQLQQMEMEMSKKKHR